MNSQTLIDLDGSGDLVKRLEELRKAFGAYSAEPLPSLAKKFRSGNGADRDGHSNRGSRVCEGLRLAATEYTASQNSDAFRKLLRDAVRDFAPTVPLFNYSPFTQTVAVTRAQAKKFSSGEQPHDHGQVFLAPSMSLGPNFTSITLNVKRQPAQHEMRDSFIAAFCAWDFETATRMAYDYKLDIPAQTHLLREIAIFIHALRGETAQALEMIESLPTRYDVDFSPCRRDLVRGILRNDLNEIRAAVTSINTRFQTVWTIKTYATSAKLRRLGNIAEMMPKIRDHIHGHNWLISHWAVAWLAFAWHKNVLTIFDDSTIFTRWIPWELCNPEPKPVSQSKARASHSRRLTKANLAELLFEAVERDDVRVFEDTLSKGADIEALSLDKLTPLLFAATYGKEHVLRAILAHQVNKAAVDFKNRDALSIAAARGDAACVEALLEAGFDSQKTRINTNPLTLAAMAKSSPTISVLLKAGANPNRIPKNAYHTPLSAACKVGSADCVELLLGAGADPNQAAINLPLLYAVEARCLKSTQLLLARGANCKARNKTSETALHIAAQRDFPDGIEVLLGVGCEIDAKDLFGATPLHMAAQYGSFLSIKSLLLHGADRNATNNEGKTPEVAATSELARDLLKSAP